MSALRAFFLLAGLFGLHLAFPQSARAECGGLTDCIGVSSDPSVAPAHSTDGVNRPAPTLDFGAQAAGLSSASRTILVAGVEGLPVGSRATLTSITLTGPNAGEFKITGGTCATGTPTLLQDGQLVAQISNACTVLVSFSPLTVGAKTAQLEVASSAITRVAPLKGTATEPPEGPPSAQPATLTVQTNTSATLDLAAFITGTVTGVGIAVNPAHGTATASGTRITYTPARNYFGPDTLSYVAVNNSGASTPAVVTIDVGGRPDPSRDSVVRSLLRAQAAAATRFSRAQTSNILRRMESLHLGSASHSSNTASRGASALVVPGSSGTRGAGAAAATVAISDTTVRVADAGESSLAGPGTRIDTPAQLGFGTSGAATAAASHGLAHGLLAAASGSLSLSSIRRADGLAEDGTGLWLGGGVNFGTRDSTDDSNAMRFTTDGVTVGVDHRFRRDLALGMSVGYGNDKTRIGDDGSESRADARSVALYASYSPARNVFVDGLLGFGKLDFDSTRYVASVADVARAERRVDQWFGSIAAGYEYRSDGLLVSPYARLDFGRDRFKRATETGAGLNALTYHDETLRRLDASLGLRAESTHRTDFGWAVPRLRIEFRHAFEDDRTATIGYADQPSGPLYTVADLGRQRDAVLLGFGSDFILRDGLKLGFDYETLRTSGPEHSHSVRLWLSKELGARGMPTGLASSSLFEEPLDIAAGLTWNDNLNRARNGADKVFDRLYSVTVDKRAHFMLTQHGRLVLSAFAGGDKLYVVNGLDRVFGGARAELQYRSSGEFDATTIGLLARAEIEGYDSSLRSGSRYGLELNLRRALTDRIGVFAALARDFRNADSEVFDARNSSARFNVDYSFGQHGVAYLGGEYQRGDAVSSVPDSPYYTAVAKAWARDDAFAGLVAYRYDARTTLWTLGYNLPLGPRDALDFSWRHTRSEPKASGANSAYSGGDGKYTGNAYSITYLMRF